MSKMTARSSLLRTSALAGSLCLVMWACGAAAQTQTYNFNIPAEPLSQSLRAFAQVSGQQIIFTDDLVAGKNAPSLHGSYSADDALAQLLAGTGLIVEHSPTGAIMVRRKNAQAASNEGAAQTRQPEIETVIVTGTNIRGLVDTPSPVADYSRDQIDLAGAGTVQEFLQKVPQNFGGGASQNAIGSLSGDSTTADATGGAGINLRGLGNDATLILINGVRVAPGNTTGNFVDVSMIPVAALDRVEIVPDGASAIYGSDAVGGVVNFILRNDYDGQETRARYGASTDGGGTEYDASQTIGRDWGSGSALLSYDYFDQLPISAQDRPYTSSLTPPFNITPSENRQSVFANGQQQIGPDVDLFAQAMFSNRRSSFDFTEVGAVQYGNSNVNTYGGTLGARWNVSANSEVQASATYSGTTTDVTGFEVGAGETTDTHSRSGMLSLDAKMDGTLWTGPTGDLKYAVGAQYLSETFYSDDLLGGGVFSPDRTVEAGFAELHVPLLGNGVTLPGVESLELDIADRYEHYSDFGATNNPKLGMIWRAYSELTFKGTYGTSFKAPQLDQLNPLPFEVVPVPLPDTTPPGTTNALLIFGGNPDLKPERATTWSFGAHYLSDSVPGLQADATFYSVHFTNRIENLQEAGYDFFNALLDASELGPQIVQRNPSLSLVQHYYGLPTFVNFYGIPASQVGAIVDVRDQNIGVVDTDGLDFGASYRTDWQEAKWEFGIDGTKIFKFNDQLTPSFPRTSILNTAYNPIDLRLRGRVIVNYDDFTFGAFVNFVNSYTNNTVTPAAPVASWTTLDVSLSYSLKSGQEYLDGLRLQIGATNVTDAAPPFVYNQILPGYNYDGANASPVGRFLYAQVSKDW